MSRRLRILTLVLAAAAAPLFAADTFTIDKTHSDVSFTVRHFVSKVHGRFGNFEGAIQIDAAKPDASSVAFTIKAASISTNDDKRDTHLRSPDFFDAEKFPDITFKSTKVAAAGKDKYDVTGTLTMHGVSKEITIPVAFLGYAKDPWGNERAGFDLSTKLNRKDYGINWNKVLDAGGTMLGDDVDVSVSLETVKKKADAPPAK
jgi:polyisoprenoid-binding protein YceI